MEQGALGQARLLSEFCGLRDISIGTILVDPSLHGKPRSTKRFPAGRTET